MTQMPTTPISIAAIMASPPFERGVADSVAAVRRWLRAQAPLPRSEFKNDRQCSAEAAE
jgi:hypothetical protein